MDGNFEQPPSDAAQTGVCPEQSPYSEGSAQELLALTATLMDGFLSSSTLEPLPPVEMKV